jgi:hypothetical protein
MEPLFAKNQHAPHWILIKIPCGYMQTTMAQKWQES